VDVDVLATGKTRTTTFGFESGFESGLGSDPGSGESRFMFLPAMLDTLVLHFTITPCRTFDICFAERFAHVNQQNKHNVITTTVHLKLRIPRRPIRRLQHLRPPIPKQRTKLEPLLPTAHRVHRPLVSQIHILANRQAHRVLVRQDGAARRFRLADHVRRAHVVKEAVVDTAGIPCVDAV
jgi:hypothetical protein